MVAAMQMVEKKLWAQSRCQLAPANDWFRDHPISRLATAMRRVQKLQT